MGHRRCSDPELLWLWYRSAAVAPIQPLSWELTYAKGAAPKSKKTKKKKTHSEKVIDIFLLTVDIQKLIKIFILYYNQDNILQIRRLISGMFQAPTLSVNREELGT